MWGARPGSPHYHTGSFEHSALVFIELGALLTRVLIVLSVVMFLFHIVIPIMAVMVSLWTHMAEGCRPMPAAKERTP
jgi:hypothetical protein